MSALPEDMRERVDKIIHQLVHPETYGFAPNPEQATKTIMSLLEEVDRKAFDRVKAYVALQSPSKEITKGGVK